MPAIHQAFSTHALAPAAPRFTPAHAPALRYTLPMMRRGLQLAALGCFAACALAAGGCARPLLSPDDQRSPFDRYDNLRNQFAQQYVEDEFGRQRPNLRARLAPRE